MNIFAPKTMMAAVERMAPVHTFIKSTFFTNEKTFVTESVEVDVKKGSRRMAPFVHPRIGSKTVENRGYQTKEYTPPTVAPELPTRAEDLLKRMAGENPYSGMSPEQRAAKKMGEDFRELNEMITRREEFMCAQVLFTGKLHVIGEGINEEIDFQFTNKKTLSGTDLWSDEGSDPLNDLEVWQDEVRVKGLVNADMCIMSTDVVKVFISHAKVKEMLDNRRIELGIINPKDLPNGAKYIGRINKLGMDIYQYDGVYLDDFTNPAEPTTKKLVPEKTLALASSDANYTMNYGAVTLIDQKTEAFFTVESTRVPDTRIEKKPAARFLTMYSKPLPVPDEIDSWLVATVL